jgi:hypothetical protein
VIRGLINQVRERVEGKKPKIPRSEVLAARPVRNPAVEWERWQRNEETPLVALLKIPRRKDRFGNLVARLFRLPDFRKLELDEIGSDVWEMCDGTNSVEALTKAVCTKYRLNRRQAETSVTAYLKMLAERRLVVLRKAASGERSGAKAAKTAPKSAAKAQQNVQQRTGGSPERRQKRA